MGLKKEAILTELTQLKEICLKLTAIAKINCRRTVIEEIQQKISNIESLCTTEHLSHQAIFDQYIAKELAQIQYMSVNIAVKILKETDKYQEKNWQFPCNLDLYCQGNSAKLLQLLDNFANFSAKTARASNLKYLSAAQLIVKLINDKTDLNAITLSTNIQYGSNINLLIAGLTAKAIKLKKQKETLLTACQQYDEPHDYPTALVSSLITTLLSLRKFKQKRQIVLNFINGNIDLSEITLPEGIKHELILKPLVVSLNARAKTLKAAQKTLLVNDEEKSSEPIPRLLKSLTDKMVDLRLFAQERQTTLAFIAVMQQLSEPQQSTPELFDHLKDLAHQHLTSELYRFVLKTNSIKEILAQLKTGLEQDTTDLSEIVISTDLTDNSTFITLVNPLNERIKTLKNQKELNLKKYEDWLNHEGYYDQLLASLITTLTKLQQLNIERQETMPLIKAHQKLLDPQIDPDMLPSLWYQACQNLKFELHNFLSDSVMLKITPDDDLHDAFTIGKQLITPGQRIHQVLTALEKSRLPLKLNLVSEIRKRLLIHFNSQHELAFAEQCFAKVKALLPTKDETITVIDIEKFIDDLFAPKEITLIDQYKEKAKTLLPTVSSIKKTFFTRQQDASLDAEHAGTQQQNSEIELEHIEDENKASANNPKDFESFFHAFIEHQNAFDATQDQFIGCMTQDSKLKFGFDNLFSFKKTTDELSPLEPQQQHGHAESEQPTQATALVKKYLSFAISKIPTLEDSAAQLPNPSITEQLPPLKPEPNQEELAQAEVAQVSLPETKLTTSTRKLGNTFRQFITAVAKKKHSDLTEEESAHQTATEDKQITMPSVTSSAQQESKEVMQPQTSSQPIENKFKPSLESFIITMNAFSSEELKEYIRTAYHIITIARNLAVKHAQNYYMHKKQSQENNHKLDRERQRMENDLDAVLTLIAQKQQLVSECNDDKTFKLFKKAEHLKQTLTHFKEKLYTLLEEYISAAAIILTTPEPQLRIANVLALQQKTMEKYFQFEQEITTHEHLAEQQKLIEALNTLYKEKKKPLIDEFKTAFKHAESALNVVKHKTETEQLLKNDQCALKKLIDAQDTLLSTLAQEKDASVKNLDEHVSNSKLRLKEFFGPRLTKITTDADKQLPELIAKNPLKSALQQAFTEMEKKSEVAINYYNFLDQLAGEDLQHWKRELTNKCDGVDKTNKHRNIIQQNAEELERRLKTKHYKTSLKIIDTLQNEYIRIIEQTPEKQSFTDEEKELLSTLKSNAEANINNSQQPLEFLAKIDPRLAKLKTLYQIFMQLNKNYIYEDYLLVKPQHHAQHDDEQYRNDLLNKVEEHLHNNHMEDISDGVRHDFIQWLRIHIIKPLQLLQQQYFKSKAHFFATYGACQTEKTLIAVGSTVYEKLKPEEQAQFSL